MTGPDTPPIDGAKLPDKVPKGGLFGGPFNSSGLDPNTRALLIDERWATTPGGPNPASKITYAFPTSKDDYLAIYTNPNDYPGNEYLGTFKSVTDEQKAAIKTAFNLVESYTNLKFELVTSGSAEAATFRFARWAEGNTNASSFAFYPSIENTRAAGDIFLAGNGDVPVKGNLPVAPSYFGTDGFNTIMHEMGHSFGLKHGHENDPNGALAPAVNDNEFSVMTYASYLGANTSQVTEARNGSAPQSYMMYDIAALQALYGANFSKIGTDARYTWDPVTGQESINGVAAPNTGTTIENKIFTTVWTQGATTTYDFSNFTEGGTLDLRPGSWSTFSKSQLADLNSVAPAGTPQYLAQGNVYNALLYQGKLDSAVKNVVGTQGGDKIIGNDVDNKITGGMGDDDIDGGKGSNTALYSTEAKNFAVTLFAGKDKFQVADKFGDDGTDMVANVQILQFTDKAIDSSSFTKVALSNKDTFITLDALYASYLQRAPDALGIDYWTAQVNNGNGMSFREVAKSFFVQPEAQGLLPAGNSEEVVKAAYSKALGRTADAAGLQYWRHELDTGSFHNDDLILGIINGALGNKSPDAQGVLDQQYINNRATVGGFFALTNGLSNTQWAKDVMTPVNETAATYDAAIAATKDYALKAAQTGSTEFVVKLIGVIPGAFAVES